MMGVIFWEQENTGKSQKFESNFYNLPVILTWFNQLRSFVLYRLVILQPYDL